MMMKQIRLIKLVWSILAVAVLLSGGEARGSQIEFTFGGEFIDAIGTPPPPWEGRGIGTEFLVSYFFDDQTPDLDINTFFAQYAIQSLSISLNGASQSTTTAEIFLNLSDPISQRYKVRFGSIEEGFVGVLRLTAPFAPLSSDAIPTDLNLDEWFHRTLELGATDGTNEAGYFGLITTFSSRVVPVPGIFLPAGLLGILFLHGRRRTAG